MKIKEFILLAKDLQNGPIPGKRIFVWNDDIEELYEYLPNKIIKELNISQLPLSKENLTNDVNIQKDIKKALNRELENYLSQLNGQQILIVYGTELIARYNIGLRSFYDYYIGDKTMVVLINPFIHLENIQSFISHDYVEINENATLRYFHNILEDENFIGV